MRSNGPEYGNPWMGVHVLFEAGSERERITMDGD